MPAIRCENQSKNLRPTGLLVCKKTEDRRRQSQSSGVGTMFSDFQTHVAPTFLEGVDPVDRSPPRQTLVS